jgi:signal transduction histidine kinase
MYVLNAQCPEGKWLRVRASPIYDDRGKQIGALAIFCDNTERRNAEQALAAEQRFLRHLIQTQDRDRQLTAYDIHDGVVQLMTGALMRLEAYRGKQGEECDSEDLHAATQQLREAIDEARRLIGGLRPPEIDEKGVVGAIEYLAAPRNHGPMKVEFIHDLPLRLSSLQETTIFRIVQEALHNAQRHSGSDRARVILRLDGDQVFLEIRDWGKGFDTKTTRMRRYGIRGIEERTRLLGGTVHIESSPGQGTMIRVSLPLNAADAHEVTETET